MNDYRTIFRPEAKSDIRKLPRQTAMAIFRKLTELENDPYGYGTTALVSAPELRRLRVGDYRVIYTIDQGELVVWIIHVGHRSKVYE